MLQISFWRRTQVTFTTVPINQLHANSKHDYVEAGFAITDFCGLKNGFTLLATNVPSLIVIDKLKLIKTYSQEKQIVKLAPLDGTSFVVVTREATVDVYNSEQEEELICGARSCG